MYLYTHSIVYPFVLMLMITDVFQTYSNVYGCFWMQAMQVQFLHGILVPDM